MSYQRSNCNNFNGRLYETLLRYGVECPDSTQFVSVIYTVHCHQQYINDFPTETQPDERCQLSFLDRIFTHVFAFRKVAAYVGAAGVGIQSIFFSKYDIPGFEGQEHIFSNARSELVKWVDRNIYGISNRSQKEAEKASEDSS